MAAFSLHLMGPFAAKAQGVLLPPPEARRIPTLLALLVLRGGELDKRYAVAQLWPDADEERGMDSLRHLVRKTCHWLGPDADRLTTPRYGYLKLRLDDTQIDVLSFDAAVRRWQRTGDKVAADEALALYAGPFLEGDFLDWAASERNERERLYEMLRATGAVVAPPAAIHPPDVALPPVFLTTFVGRDAEREGVCLALNKGGTRLLTLWGPGGVGKTRIACLLAAAAKTPVCFLDLSVLPVAAAEERIYTLLADALGKPADVQESPDSWSVRHLKQGRWLLLLDNTEHLVESAAQVAIHLLSACANLQILATSRRPLGVVGEVLWSLPPLPLDEAVALFVERAQASAPKTVLDEAATQALCQHLDGLPLALELAATHLRWLTLAQLETQFTRRFAILAGGLAPLPERHRALEATFIGSWELLSEPERQLLARLSLFAGSFSLESVLAICEGELEVLERLVSHSLVVPGERLYLLESLREFASARLQEREAPSPLRHRFCAYYYSALDGRANALWKDGQAEAMHFFRDERENLRRALTWELEAGDSRLIYLLLQFWDRRNEFSEAHDALEDALAHSENAEGTRGLLGWKAHFLHRQNRHVEALPILESLVLACEAAHHEKQLISVLNALGNVYGTLERWDEARACFQRMRLLCESDPEMRGWLPHALQGIALAFQSQGKLNEALVTHEEALILSQANQSELLEAMALQKIAQLRVLQGDFREARALLEKVLELAQRIEDPNIERAAREQLALLPSP